MPRRSRTKARLSEFGAKFPDDRAARALEHADKRPCLDTSSQGLTFASPSPTAGAAAVGSSAARGESEASQGAESGMPRPVGGEAPAIPRGSFISAGGTGELVQRILKRWGWEEIQDASCRVFDLKWTTQVRQVEDLVLPKSQLVNHFRGTDFLNHKSRMGRCLGRCPACADLFFPRQYNLYNAKALRKFLCDYILTQASVCCHRREGQDPVQVAAVRRTALRVLGRRQDECCGTPSLLRCVHESELLFGAGSQVPPGEEAKIRPFLNEFFEGKAASECLACGMLGVKAGEEREDTASTSSGGSCSSTGAGDSSDSTSAGRQDITHPAGSVWQNNLNGPSNAWVVKDPCLSRGRSVTTLTGLRSILSHCERSHSCGLRWNCVVQKYVERPLLVPSSNGEGSYLAKADLRAWVLVLDWNPLVAFAHPTVYFRVATKPYEFHASGRAETYAHATNCRDEDNRCTLRQLFARCGPSSAKLWESRTWPLLLDGVRASLLAVRDGVLGVEMDFKRKKKLDNSSGPRAFELFGFDFAVDEGWRPWLLEANSSPDMLRSCVVPEIQSWAEEATESMLRIALLYRSGGLSLPKPGELEKCSAPGSPSGTPDERLFEPSDLASEGHCRERCYGEVVARLPQCLVRGMELGPECGGWRLIQRERTVDEAAVWQSYVAQEHDVCDMASENLSHGRVLREVLLSCGSSQRRQAMAEQQQQQQQQKRGTASVRVGASATAAPRPSASSSSRSLRSSHSLSALRGSTTTVVPPVAAPDPGLEAPTEKAAARLRPEASSNSPRSGGNGKSCRAEAASRPQLEASSPRSVGNPKSCKAEAQQSSGMLVRGQPILPPLP